MTDPKAALTSAQIQWTSAFVGIDLDGGTPAGELGGTAAIGDGEAGGAPGAGKQGGARSDKELHDLARWPGEAHKAWKRLPDLQRAAVVVTMTKLYGDAFAKAFLGFTRSGARLDQHHYGTGTFPEGTPKWFADHGYGIAQQDSLQVWWVHPSGHVITKAREEHIRNCNDEHAEELLRLAIDGARDDIYAAEKRKKEYMELDAKIRDTDTMSDEYYKLSEESGRLLAEGRSKVAEALEDLSTSRSSLTDLCTNLGTLDDLSAALKDLKGWFAYADL